MPNINNKAKRMDLIKLILYHIFLFVIVPLIWIAMELFLLIMPYNFNNNKFEVCNSGGLLIFYIMLNIFIIPYYFYHISFFTSVARDVYKGKYYIDGCTIYDNNKDIIGRHDWISRDDALKSIKEYKKYINSQDNEEDIFTPYDRCMEAIINTPALKKNIDDGELDIYINKEAVKDIINKNWFLHNISRRCAEELLDEINRLEYVKLAPPIYPKVSILDDWKVCAIDENPEDTCCCIVTMVSVGLHEELTYCTGLAKYNSKSKKMA